MDDVYKKIVNQRMKKVSQRNVSKVMNKMHISFRMKIHKIVIE